MRFLVYGAGNIGSLYAARLAQSSQEVAILARGTRLEQIRQRGIELEDGISGKRTTTSLHVVDRLDPDDAYDVVLVILPKHRSPEVLPVLAANGRTPSVMFFIGELDGSKSDRIVAIASSLQAAGFPVSVCTNMDAWLKTHVAKILPTVCALYRAGGEPEQLASSDELLRLMLRSIREGYQVLRANGVPITPGNHRVLEWLPESILLFLMRRMLKTETAAIKFGHAEQGRAEWMLLADEFRQLIAQAGIPTPSIDAAYRNLSAA
jgi:2-dehydropantoate 2-reductase